MSSENASINVQEDSSKSLSQTYLSESKLIRCNVHNSFRISDMAKTIIDTPEFQRLRHIKQLGCCHYVYPSAQHTRFEHSLGVYYLAGLMVDHISKKYPTRLFNIPVYGGSVLFTPKIAELIKIAGLCHDIGHGPFSHAFDSIVAKSTSNNKEHEKRSCLITEMLCKKHFNDYLTDADIAFVQSVIHPSESDTGAIYQIVANKLNGIDVDKFDYLLRDAMNLGLSIDFDHHRLTSEFIIDHNGNIAYPKQSSTDIYSLFHSRYILNKKAYQHKTVEIIGTMMIDIVKHLNEVFHFDQMIDDLDAFCRITDTTIIEFIKLMMAPPEFITINLSPTGLQAVQQAIDLYVRITNRDLYCLIEEIVEDPNVGLNVSRDITAERKALDIIESCVASGCPRDDFFISHHKAGYVGTDIKKLFDSIYFYRTPENNTSFILQSHYFCGLINGRSQERMIRIVCKNRSTVERFNSMA